MMRAVVVPSELLPQHDSDEADRAEDRAEHDARWQLATGNAPPVLERHFAQRHRANDQRRRLRARVAARADDERDEQCEHHSLADLALEVPHRRRREPVSYTHLTL